MGGGVGWAAGGGLKLPTGLFGGSCFQDVLVISPDKPGWPKRHVTNTG